MEFRRLGPKASSTKVSSAQEKYPTDLSMYLDPPTDVIEIEEFQKLAMERVKFLRVLETVSVRFSKESTYKEQVLEEINKLGIKYFLPLVRGYADQETRRRDYLSHFILRLCYCRSEEYRRWFLARELEFFKLKFYNMDKREDIISFMARSNLDYSPISESEKLSISSELINSTQKNVTFDTCNFYKVPFTKVLDLVRSRKVLIKGGFAYVPYQDLVSILSSIFRTKLSHALSICCANLPSLESDERLAKILKGLHTSYSGKDFVQKDMKNVPYSAIDALSKKSFPPCMRSMYETFKKTHHLKHQARQQLGLFIKGIGVSLEDSLRFWREGFTQRPEIDHDKFQKLYAYNIRHSYGQEGKRANYAPQTCMKIITTNVGPQENHGCPFRHCDATSLRQRLQNFGLSVRDVSEVVELASRSHYQLACTRYFEITHNVTGAAGINHPNQYFEDSQAVISGVAKKEEDKGKSNFNGRTSTSHDKQGQSTDDWGDVTIANISNIMAEAEKPTEPSQGMDVD